MHAVYFQNDDDNEQKKTDEENSWFETKQNKTDTFCHRIYCYFMCRFGIDVRRAHDREKWHKKKHNN